MTENLIFVSCGQFTQAEKDLGSLLKETIDGQPGFEAYFADTVHNFDTLGRNVFDALRRCAGAVAVLPDRGMVIGPEGKEWGHRFSVWINQDAPLKESAYSQLVRRLPHEPVAHACIRQASDNP